MGIFPTMKANRLLALLTSNKLGHKIVASKGSHRTLTSPRYPKIILAFHENRELSGIEVKKVLCGQVGLTVTEALEVLK